ncbi:MAG TPA: DUF2891 family protein, partial [Terriglobia bacterium]|nr:DUF2891 family protein [Terriglobia bacterium]
MQKTPVILAFCLAAGAALIPARAQEGQREKIAAYIKSMPPVKAPDYNETERLALAANPLGCEEHPHASGPPGGIRSAQYLWQRDGKPQIAADYDHHHAFYGCLDWHSAVNSTWMMVSLIKGDSTIAVAPAIRSELEYHIQKTNIDGEMDYFTHLQGVGADFEMPYGYAWLLKLYGGLKSWDDPEGKRASATLEPMATWFAKQFTDYLNSLNYPIRVGLHPNTALDMGFVLDYVADTHDEAMEETIRKNALRLFQNDTHCPTSSEPVFGDFASPCLTEAALMGRILSPAEYAKWLTDFLPPVYSDEFALYSKPIDAVHGSNRDTTGTDEEGLPNAHLIGLNFQRATDLMWIATSLPQDDPRVAAYRMLADINGKQAYAKIGLGGYLGTHWLATYALMYENVLALEAQKSA